MRYKFVHYQATNDELRRDYKLIQDEAERLRKGERIVKNDVTYEMLRPL